MIPNPFDQAICMTLDDNLINSKGNLIFNELPEWKIKKFIVSGKHKQLFGYVDHEDVFVSNDPKFRHQAYNYYLCIQKIIQQAKEDGLDNIVFFEDDAVLCPTFNNIFPLAIEELCSRPEWYSWDLLFLGGNHNLFGYSKITPHIIRPNYSLDYHAVVFNWKIFDLVLSLQPSGYATFDGKMADMQRKGLLTAYALNPTVITQRAGFSTNENRWVDRSINHNLEKLP